MNETAKATIKAHLKENNINLNGLGESLKELSCLKELASLKDLDALKDLNDLGRLKELNGLGHLKQQTAVENPAKSSMLPKLPNDYLTEMFSANCTMNQSSLSAMETMETIYSHFYRDYLASSSKTLAAKMKNENSLNDLSFLNTFSSKTDLNKIDVRPTNGLSAASSQRTNSKLTSSLAEQRSSRLSSANDQPGLSLSHQLPVNTTKPTEVASRFLTPLQIDKNQTKKPRPKRFRCPHCDIAFSNNGQLKGHIRTHTGRLLLFRSLLQSAPTSGRFNRGLGRRRMPPDSARIIEISVRMFT